jgi:3,4-dihydroxy 2-butanone 4-phosphate synthase/GTP cyclohydrolase II
MTIEEVLPAPLAVRLPTPYGFFTVHAFERPSGHVYLALTSGDVEGHDDVLVRVHSECLTGDALGSLRCDCGVQLRQSLRMITAAGAGVLIYATGHEGRGIGLMNKLRAYVAQEEGADTVEANHVLGLPADARDYGDAAAVIDMLGIQSIRLLTNNPDKVSGLRRHGIDVNGVVGIPTVAHRRNATYLRTKSDRMGHVRPTGVAPESDIDVVDPSLLIGDVEPQQDRPGIVLKLAQSLDGRIATRTGDSKWISGPAERRVAHSLRATCDAVIVGAGTIVADDPQLTVRDVPGASPLRVVVDTALRSPSDAKVFTDDGSTIVLTTSRSDSARREQLRQLGVAVEVVAEHGGHVDLDAGLRRLRELGVEVALVEGGATLVTAMLEAGVADRLIVSVSPLVLGSGIDAIGDLRTRAVADAVTLSDRTLALAGDDVLIAGNIDTGTRRERSGADLQSASVSESSFSSS